MSVLPSPLKPAPRAEELAASLVLADVVCNRLSGEADTALRRLVMGQVLAQLTGHGLAPPSETPALLAAPTKQPEMPFPAARGMQALLMALP